MPRIQLSNLLFFLPALLVSILAGCAGHNPGRLGTGSTEYEMIASAMKHRPIWIDVVPESTGGIEVFVGLSDYFETEKKARDDALLHAISTYAEYTGVEVSILDETLKHLQGTETDVLTQQIARENRTTFEVSTTVSRIKPRSWYWEKYQATKDGKDSGIVWRYWVEVIVPVDELDRINEEKRKKIEKQARMEKQARAQAASEISFLLDNASRVQSAAHEAVDRGELVAALTSLHEERNRIVNARAQYVSKGVIFDSEYDRLNRPISELDEEIQNIQNSVIIDVGRFNKYCLIPGGGGEEISVWAWIRSDKALRPLRDIPLVLEGETTGNRFSTRTNKQGMATFYLATVEDRVYRIGIDESLVRLNPNLIKGARNAVNRIYVNNATSSFDDLVQQGARDLFQGASEVQLPVKSLIFGAVTHEGSPEGGRFAVIVKELLGQALTGIDGLKVIIPRKHSARELNDTMRENTALKIRGVGSGAAQAQINNAESALVVNFRLVGPDVQLSLSLLYAKTGELVRQAMVTIPRYLVPRDIHLLPSSASESKSPLLNSGAINIDIASQLGNGQTYQEGETISYFVSSDRDAYLLLIYQDAGGNLIQIHPNRYSGNEVFKSGNYIEIPRISDGFEFIIKAPFGVENIWVFACDRPLPELKGQDIGNGLTLLSESLDSILRTLRTTGGRPGIAYGEARATITTIAKR